MEQSGTASPTSATTSTLEPKDQMIAKYMLGEVLGTGAFSEVRTAIDKVTGGQYAIKIIDKSKCKGKESMIQTEVSILMKAKHDNIIQLYEMFETDNKIYLVMELVTGGELFDDIVSKGKYTEAESARIVQRILLAIDYLHSIGIAHRDLKPENLLLSDKTPAAKIMISDFGLSKIFNADEMMKTACGTPGYVAPEVLKRQGYGKEIDLWSLGVITYILLCGYPPFYDQNNVELFKQIMAGRYEFDKPWWDNISEHAKDFIRNLLLLDPKQRFTASQALQHPFITLNTQQEIRTIREPQAAHFPKQQQNAVISYAAAAAITASATSAPNSARSSTVSSSSTLRNSAASAGGNVASSRQSVGCRPASAPLGQHLQQSYQVQQQQQSAQQYYQQAPQAHGSKRYHDQHHQQYTRQSNRESPPSSQNQKQSTPSQPPQTQDSASPRSSLHKEFSMKLVLKGEPPMSQHYMQQRTAYNQPQPQYYHQSIPQYNHYDQQHYYHSPHHGSQYHWQPQQQQQNQQYDQFNHNVSNFIPRQTYDSRDHPNGEEVPEYRGTSAGYGARRWGWKPVKWGW